ncbi:TetR/AcrR family transcriptional regulator [Sandaracinobacter sp. RS1-74]|uniref:TetR/AcrR family transcriptional regulator n=1 Tax=Sandaracinobacteroides sayramensis TaxID=2913411 RepID=UPI001EDA2EBE|nr:TetR/AcrR family transcriptional regulator [Sandaracinobacteroides sayramensis]MCG2841382.1 TetR/AcrR family transcriptional regulator [Sandaracinobacteroides sayramensis]
MARRIARNAAKVEPAVELETKLAPSQDRARVTFELILEVTGELLSEVGVERLSTNMICERAGITPPALYRYFPNKYAILREIGRRLMEAEDAIVFDWLKEGKGAVDGPLEEAVRQRAELLARVRQVARSQPGGLWILRAMGALPVLREVRAESVREVAGALFEQLRVSYPGADAERLHVATLLSTALGSAANEMVIDEPHLESRITDEMARLTTLYYRDLLSIPNEGSDKE